MAALYSHLSSLQKKMKWPVLETEDPDNPDKTVTVVYSKADNAIASIQLKQSASG